MSRLQQLQTLLDKEPKDVFLNFGLAMELAKAGRHDEALTQFDRTRTLDPNYIPAWFQKGRTQVSMGDIDAAKRTLADGIVQAAACGDWHAKGEMEELLSTL